MALRRPLFGASKEHSGNAKCVPRVPARDVGTQEGTARKPCGTRENERFVPMFLSFPYKVYRSKEKGRNTHCTCVYARKGFRQHRNRTRNKEPEK
jgi:hypothetical protein